MTVLTAYNEQVRKWTAAPTAKARTFKEIRMAMFEACFGGIFEKAFTKARKSVLDEIIYKSAETGIYAAKAETIADNCGLSVKTVTRAVAEIKKSNEYVIAYSATGRKGGYIFIDSKHEKFSEIMVGLFGEKIAAGYIKSEHEGEQESEQQNAETPTESNAEATKMDEPTSLSTLDAKDLNKEHKNLKGGITVHNANNEKEQNRPSKTALYIRLSEALATKFDKSGMVRVMKRLESMRKSMQISDDLAFVTALETAEADNCRNFFALWSYKIKNALGLISRAVEKALPVALQSDKKETSNEDKLAELLALKAQNDKTGELPAWYYDSKIAKLKKAVNGENTAKAEIDVVDFEAEARKIREQLNFA